MLNFYPGPSKLYTDIDQDIEEAFTSGIISMNHRSTDFMTLYAEVQKGFEESLDVPEGYKVYFTSSATECWDILAKSFSGKTFLHIYNGEFGKKWMETNEQAGNPTVSKVFDIHSEVNTDFSEEELMADIVCTTLVETSNGTFLTSEVQYQVRTAFSEALIAVDATSGMAGMPIEWDKADIWYASVQKCFGLPSGLCVLILSPEVHHAIEFRSKDTQYNSLKRIVANGKKFQTTHTPNILDIYLLSKRIQHITEDTSYFALEERMKYLYTHFSNHAFLRPLIIEKRSQSATVLALKGDEEYIIRIKKALKDQGIIIGSGYGIWKENTLRIANFPAHADEEFTTLLNAL
ncbi:MAG: aminotransferase class V-fold PLP-dependent enzyme [Cytophagales bacterium]|nr:aminotransferase class V-fold PLP-dependent enzyme [Cytophaga sp.]